MICIESEFDTFPPRPIVPPQCWNWHKKARWGLGMTVEKRDKRIVVYLTESENELVTRAAGRARRRPSEVVRLVAIDWANSQVERAHQERGQG